MRVALVTTFAASRKEPLAAQMDRLHQALANAGLGAPVIRFTFGDPLVPGFTSSVDRVLKRYPDLARFVTDAEPVPGIRGARRISNGPHSPAAGDTIAYETLQAIAAGVPRSFPFHSVMIQFFVDAFGTLTGVAPRTPDMLPGLLLSDSWWVNGRIRSLTACSIVDADAAAKKLRPPDALAAVFAACGKARKSIQVPVPDAAAAAAGVAVRLPGGALATSADPAAAQAVKPIVDDYRNRMAEIAAHAAMPHDLPELQQALQESPPGGTAGPRKPALERAFTPLGYSCAGGSGTFTLRRRTAANHTVELHLDVGTWSHLVVGIFRVMGVGFKASLMVPVAPRAAAGAQYPIRSPEQWLKVVENIAALVRELDRTFVPDVERAAGPSPAWYQPES
jgi:hypothetical protein